MHCEGLQAWDGLYQSWPLGKQEPFACDLTDDPLRHPLQHQPGCRIKSPSKRPLAPPNPRGTVDTCPGEHFNRPCVLVLGGNASMGRADA